MAEQRLSPARLEAFSDGVIAVIITIMVLELHVPTLSADPSNAHALSENLKLVFIYLLSFLQVGIYWVNHHYLTDEIEQVTHGILWSNLALLFSLSLFPVATNWVGVRGMTSFSLALYSVVCAFPGISWLVLSSLICRHNGKTTLGGFGPQVFSFLLYVSAIPLAFVSPYISLGLILVVAIRWLIPPKEIVQLTRKPPAQYPEQTNFPHTR